MYGRPGLLGISTDTFVDLTAAASTPRLQPEFVGGLPAQQ